MFLSEAFLTAVLQDYGRAHGISTDALTFTHQVLPSTIGSKEEEFSIIVQKTLNLVRRAFKVPGCSGREEQSLIRSVISSTDLTPHVPISRQAGYTRHSPPSGPHALTVLSPTVTSQEQAL